MAPRELEVFVQIAGEDVLAGRLWPHRRSRGGESQTFAYASSYLERKGAYALDPALPLVAGQQQTPLGREMFGAFADCAPDRWGRMLIQRRARKDSAGPHTAEESFGEIDYLLGVRDDLRQGALRFRDPGSGEFLADERGGVPHLVDLPRLLAFAERAERDVASAEELEVLLKGGSSLGGARPKAHVIDGNGSVAIAKFPRPEGDEWDVPGWEAVALELARDAGLAVAAADLHEIAGRSVLVVDRFDRSGERRIGYVSAMTMLEATDGEQGTYLDLVEAIEEQSDRPTADLRQLWRRVVFSVLVSNTDDHLRNHGFLRVTTGGWSLSPAFDLNPNPEAGRKRFATPLDGGSDETTLDRLLDAADLFGLGEEAARAAAAEVSEATGRWREVARRLGQSAASVALMETAFDHPSAELGRELAAAVAG